MAIFHAVDVRELLDFSLRMALAFVLATAIGAVRQYRQRNAGLRTNVLVAVGAASFNQVWGPNTAAPLRCSAAGGALCGVDLAAEAAVLTIAVLAGNTLLRPLVNRINHAQMEERAAEASYEVHVLTRG